MSDENPPIVTIAGKTFQLHPLPSRKALRFNAAFEALVIPVLGGFEGITLQSNFNFAAAALGLSKALSELDHDKHWHLLLALFETTQYLPTIGKPVFLKDEAGMDAAFRGDIQAIHQLCWAVMKANHFPFVELGNRFGALLQQIAGSMLAGQNTAKSTAPSENSESSTQS